MKIKLDSRKALNQTFKISDVTYYLLFCNEGCIMTNITLSIEDSVYKKMHEHSEIKWSEFVRKAIKKRLGELDSLKKGNVESIFTMLASEEVLKKEWDNEADERWNNV